MVFLNEDHVRGDNCGNLPDFGELSGGADGPDDPDDPSRASDEEQGRESAFIDTVVGLGVSLNTGLPPRECPLPLDALWLILKNLEAAGLVATDTLQVPADSGYKATVFVIGFHIKQLVERALRDSLGYPEGSVDVEARSLDLLEQVKAVQQTFLPVSRRSAMHVKGSNFFDSDNRFGFIHNRVRAFLENPPRHFPEHFLHSGLLERLQSESTSEGVDASVDYSKWEIATIIWYAVNKMTFVSHSDERKYSCAARRVIISILCDSISKAVRQLSSRSDCPESLRTISPYAERYSKEQMQLINALAANLFKVSPELMEDITEEDVQRIIADCGHNFLAALMSKVIETDERVIDVFSGLFWNFEAVDADGLGRTITGIRKPHYELPGDSPLSSNVLLRDDFPALTKKFWVLLDMADNLLHRVLKMAVVKELADSLASPDEERERKKGYFTELADELKTTVVRPLMDTYFDSGSSSRTNCEARTLGILDRATWQFDDGKFSATPDPLDCNAGISSVCAAAVLQRLFDPSKVSLDGLVSHSRERLRKTRHKGREYLQKVVAQVLGYRDCIRRVMPAVAGFSNEELQKLLQEMRSGDETTAIKAVRLLLKRLHGSILRPLQSNLIHSG